MASQPPSSLFDYHMNSIAQKSGFLRIPEKRFVPFNSPPSNPLQYDVGDHQPPTGLDIHLSFKSTMCKSCCFAVLDSIATDFSSRRWKHVQTDYGTLKCLLDHQNQNMVRSLLESKSRGCELCTLSFDLLIPNYESEILQDLTYCIFLKSHDKPTHQLYVCLGATPDSLDVQSWLTDLHKKEISLFQIPATDANGRPDNHPTSTHHQHFSQHSLTPVSLADHNLGSDQSFRLALEWLHDCRTNHQSCEPEYSPFPKRLLDLNSLHINNTVYLYLSLPTDTGVYATISYTWGASGYKRYKTKNFDPERPDLTEASHCKGITLDKFPETLQDGIRIAKRLDFRYLWIDSVCIVQDDDDDWVQQSAEMTQIYAGARLNISATSGENSECKILKSLKHHGVNIGNLSAVPHKSNNETMCSVSTCPPAIHQDIYIGRPLDVPDLEDQYLATRGWVFQERLVSPATLHYTNLGMLWECTYGIKTSQAQGFRDSEWKSQWKALIDHGSMSARKPGAGSSDYIAETPVDTAAALESWNGWVAAYAERALYDSRDRLPAIAGVAKKLARRFKLTYKAGLWQEDLLGGLMWKRFNRTETLTRFEGEGAPSWSWASVQGRLDFVNVRLRGALKGPMLEIIAEAEVQEERPGFFGRVCSGRMRVKGMLQKIVVDNSVHPGVQKRDSDPVGVKSGFVNPVNVFVMLDEPHRADASCWCLRLGSYDDDGREGDVFLLLELVNCHVNYFKRVGIAETDPWSSLLSVTGDSGKLQSAELCEITLV